METFVTALSNPLATIIDRHKKPRQAGVFEEQNNNAYPTPVLDLPQPPVVAVVNDHETDVGLDTGARVTVHDETAAEPTRTIILPV